MTAQRWWVRAAARWLARVDGVSGQFRLGFLAATGVSTTLVALRDYGYGEFAPAVLAVSAVGAALFAYLYTEGGVWNQMARDRQDMSNNFASPNGLIVAQMQATALAAAQKGEPLTEREREAVREEARETFDSLRDGVELPDD
jgi:hypothetical protein